MISQLLTLFLMLITLILVTHASSELSALKSIANLIVLSACLLTVTLNENR